MLEIKKCNDLWELYRDGKLIEFSIDLDYLVDIVNQIMEIGGKNE